jgi:hypothetical protein
MSRGWTTEEVKGFLVDACMSADMAVWENLKRNPDRHFELLAKAAAIDLIIGELHARIDNADTPYNA